MRVFLASPWIPAEWVRAHGLAAHGIWFAERFGREAPPLTAGVCAFAENVVGFAETEPDAAVIFPSSCDQLRRSFDAVAFRGPARVFLFNLPATRTPAAKEIYRAEMERLGRFLMELGGSAPTAERLGAEISQTAAVRRRLRGAAPGMSGRAYAEAVARFHTDGQFQEVEASATSQSKEELRGVPEVSPVPLALLGGPLGRADWNWFDAVEAAGGRVVLNGTETGERGLSPAFGDCRDPFAALVAGYFDNIVDVFQRPNTRLYAWLKPRLLSRRVRGIVLRCFTGCDLWRAEAQSLRDVFGLPVLLLEADEGSGLSPRDANRLQALVEMQTPAPLQSAS